MNNQNMSKGHIVAIIVFFIVMFLFPFFGILLFFVGFVYILSKIQRVYNGEKKTDYSGMNKSMVSSQVVHQHDYRKKTTDFCGTDKNIAGKAKHEHNFSSHATDFCGTDKKMTKGYDNRDTAQIYDDMVNRKTDYSGVNPNLLKRG